MEKGLDSSSDLVVALQVGGGAPAAELCVGAGVQDASARCRWALTAGLGHWGGSDRTAPVGQTVPT